MNELIRLIKLANYVFICGNGGSNSTAEHFAEDLFSKGVKAFNLGSNSSLITMIANDFGYQFVYSKQIERYATKEDLLIAISCSGKSENVSNAIQAAKFKGLSVYEFETFKKDRDYGKLEDKHLQLVHKIKDLL
jgi:D-sedoheptulose 7-phosphate isomerase